MPQLSDIAFIEQVSILASESMEMGRQHERGNLHAAAAADQKANAALGRIVNAYLSVLKDAQPRSSGAPLTRTCPRCGGPVTITHPSATSISQRGST